MKKQKQELHNVTQSGFSLLEVAIVILMLGLIAVPLIQAFRAYQTARADDKTQESVANAAAALAEYFSINNEYPCPANPTLLPTNNDNGLENCTAAAGGPGFWPRSPANGFNFNGNAGEPDRDGIGGVDQIFRGALPFRTLGIPYEDSVDGFGSKLTYVVSASTTSWYDAQPGALPSPTKETYGVIQVEIETGKNDVTFARTFAPAAQIVNDVNGDNWPDTGLLGAIVFSHGPDRRGAFSNWGGFDAVACDGATNPDEENCDGDAFFRSRNPSDVAGAEFFDDIVAARLWTYQGTWLQNGGQGSVSPTAPTNLGIGVGLPEERLHVAGNIRADNYHTTWVCDEASTDADPQCFFPSLIGGAGFTCPGGRVLKGFADGNPVCESPAIIPPVFAGQSCGLDDNGAQMFVAGFNANGTLRCEVR